MLRAALPTTLQTPVYCVTLAVCDAASVMHWAQSDKISHIDTEVLDDHIDTLISHIISPYPISISGMTISIW